MRLLQVTDIVSHHQLPIARILANSLGEDNFRFAATSEPDVERLKLGWSNDESAPWILRVGDTDAEPEEFDDWWDNADAVICGERLLDRIERRLERRELTFNMSERWLKPPIGIARVLHPQFLSMALRFRKMASSSYFHLLSTGDYSAYDMNRIAAFTGRTWQWGYFTATPDPLPECTRPGKVFSVLCRPGVCWAAKGSIR